MTTTSPAPPAQRRSDWLGGVFAAGMAAVLLVGWLLDIQSFAWFLLTMAADLVLTILFLVWWFTRRSFSLAQRFLICVSALLLGLLAARLTSHTIAQPVFLIFSGVPLLVAVWWLWFIATR